MRVLAGDAWSLGARADLRYLDVIEEADLGDPVDRTFGELSLGRATAGCSSASDLSPTPQTTCASDIIAGGAFRCGATTAHDHDRTRRTKS